MKKPEPLGFLGSGFEWRRVVFWLQAAGLRPHQGATRFVFQICVLWVNFRTYIFITIANGGGLGLLKLSSDNN